ncbi:MAG: hypothetical protein ACFB4J_15060 [Elainellaceae cyanobacterium]
MFTSLRVRNAWQFAAGAVLSSIAVVSGLALVAPDPAMAVDPERARIEDILGNSSELFIRRGNRREPIQIESALQRSQDALITAPPNNAYAVMKFFSQSGEDLNFYIQTSPHTEPTIYHFPCSAQGNYQIGWGLAENESRGCEEGMTLLKGQPPRAQAPLPIAWLKQLAQGPVRRVYYCTAVGQSGPNFETAMSGDPCTEALEACQAAGDASCQVSTKGFWWTSEEQMHASLDCLSADPRSTEGTGQAIEANIQALLQETQGQDSSCLLHVFRPDDFVMIPAPDEIVQGLGDDEILVQVRDTPTGIQLDVLKGAINVRSVHNSNSDLQLVSQGERYVHSGAANQVTTFDRQQGLRSIDMEILCAFASQPDNDLNVPACFEVGLLPTADGRPVAYCDLEQASGGQEGDERILQMSRPIGEIEIEYEMFDVPDRLQIIHEGREILDTGFVSSSRRISVPFSGSSGRVKVSLTGNFEIDTTEWNYTLYCPK